MTHQTPPVMIKHIALACFLLGSTSTSHAQWLLATSPATNVTAGSATLNGGGSCLKVGSNCISNTAGGKRGFVYGTGTDPLVGTTEVVTDMNLIVTLQPSAPFTAGIGGLTDNTTYNYWAFHQTTAGTKYGNMVSFKTQTIAPPTTNPPTNIKALSATGNGNKSTIWVLGNPMLSERGMLWSTTNTRPALTTTNKCITTDVGNDYSCALTGLAQNTTYYVWAYATYGNGTTKYGNPVNFTTPTLPAVTTTAAVAASIRYNSATTGGNVTAQGSSAVTDRGVVWGLSTNPTGNKKSSGTGLGVFTTDLTGLPDGTTIHFRAYATSTAGTAYGTDMTFTTPNSPPDLQPRPRSSDAENRVLFQKSGGTVIAGTENRQQVPASICNALTLGSPVATRTFPYNTGPVNCGQNCRELQYAVTLPPVIYKATNTGHSNAGAFNVTLHRQLSINGQDGPMVEVASKQVTGLNAGATSSVFSYQPPELVNIFTYPDSYSAASDVKKYCTTDRTSSGSIKFAEKAYVVKVDGGNSANSGQVIESNESNNEVDPMRQ